MIEKKQKELSSLICSKNNATSLNKKEIKIISLPFMTSTLLVCNDLQVGQAISNLLSDIKNIELKTETKLTFITQDYQLAIVVYTGDEIQTNTEIEKISNASVSIILVGDNLPQALLRKSIQLSIKDFVPLTTAESELIPAIQSIAKQLTAQVNLGSVVSVINGKGGAGASFIASSIAQLVSDSSEHEIALFDADLQHGTLADSFNFEPNYFLDDALAEVNELDSMAIKTMMSSRDNLSLLPIKAYSQLNHLSHIDSNKINLLLSKMRVNFKLLITDLSRGLDALSIPIIETSDHIIIVIQQNIVSIREAKALVNQLKNIMGISSDKLHVVVNRFCKKHSSIDIDDITKAIGIDSVFTISNDYQLANACTDLGKTIAELPNSKHIEKDFFNVIKNITPLDVRLKSESSSFWAKLTGKS